MLVLSQIIGVNCEIPSKFYSIKMINLILHTPILDEEDAAFGIASATIFGDLLMWACDAPNLGVPLINRQPAEFLWISGDPIPHCCVPFIEIHIFTKIG